MASAQAVKVPPVWVKFVRVCVEGVLISVVASARAGREGGRSAATTRLARSGEKGRDAPPEAVLARSCAWCIPVRGPSGITPQGEPPCGDLRRFPGAVCGRAGVDGRP